MLYWLAYGIPTIILLGGLIYAVLRAGRLSPRQKERLDANTRMTQQREDPVKQQQASRQPATRPIGSAPGGR